MVYIIMPSGKIIMKTFLRLLLLGTVILVGYLLFYPVPIDPAGWIPPELPEAEGVYAPNELLQAGERIATGNVGTEAVVFDSDGRLHTGLDNGDAILPNPFLSRVVFRLPTFLRPSPDPHGYILGFDLDGNVIYNLQDPEGEVYYRTISVIEYEGNLYIGSIEMDGILRIPVPDERL